MMHPFEEHIRKETPFDQDIHDLIGLPPSFSEFWQSMKGRWNIAKAERCLVEVLRAEGMPGAHRLIEDALAQNFNSRVGDLRTVLRWINYVLSHSPLDANRQQRWVHWAMTSGSPEALHAMRIADGSLEANGRLLSAVVLSRNPDLLAFFPEQKRWDPGIRRLIATLALKVVAQSPQRKGSEQLLNALLYPEMDVSQVSVEMLNSKPILRALIRNRIRPPLTGIKDVIASHRTELYKAGLLTAVEARVSSKMKRNALDKDLQL
jgi:hypothetical protein